MTLPNDSILVTPGAGATVATHLAGGKEYQAIIAADDSGHLIGSLPVYCVNIPNQVHVAVADTVHWDLFNADASAIVRVKSIKQIPDVVTPVTGVSTSWKFTRTTAVGTGGTVITPWLPDLSQATLDADITCRSKPTGGATEGDILRNYIMSSEEAYAGTHIWLAAQGLELVPPILGDVSFGKGIVLRQNQGLRVVQITSSAAGNTAWLLSFTVE